MLVETKSESEKTRGMYGMGRSWKERCYMMNRVALREVWNSGVTWESRYLFTWSFKGRTYL